MLITAGEALVSWWRARQAWRVHMADCDLCAEYYTEEEGLCEAGALLMRAIAAQAEQMDSIAEALNAHQAILEERVKWASEMIDRAEESWPPDPTVPTS